MARRVTFQPSIRPGPSPFFQNTPLPSQKNMGRYNDSFEKQIRKTKKENHTTCQQEKGLSSQTTRHGPKSTKKEDHTSCQQEKGLSSQTTRHGPETSTEKGPIQQTSTEKSSIHVASGIGAILPWCQPKSESLPQSIHVLQHRLSS